MRILKSSTDDYTRILQGAGIEQSYSGILKEAVKNGKGTLVTIVNEGETREHFIPENIADEIRNYVGKDYLAEYVLFVAMGRNKSVKRTLEIRKGNEVVYRYPK